MAKDKQDKQSPEAVVRQIRRETRRKWNAEENIRIVLEGWRGESSIAELCRREGTCTIYKWSKELLEVGKVRGDTQPEATSGDMSALKQEDEQLKLVVAELVLRNWVLKKLAGAAEKARLSLPLG